MSKVSGSRAVAFEGFTKATNKVKQRIIAASFGEVGTLKTSFWLSAPGPIALFSLDQGLEGVIEPFQEEKDIWVKEYEWNPTDELSQQEAIDLRDEFIRNFEYAVQNARTVVIDKETQLWELFRYAEFGAPNDAPKNYPQLYQRYRRLVNMPKAFDINFGLIQGMRTPWEPKINRKTGAQGAVKTDQRVRKGMDEVDELVHVNIEHFLGPVVGSEDEGNQFQMRIGKARGPGGRDIQNSTLPAMTFPEFAQLVFPGTDESDWT